MHLGGRPTLDDVTADLEGLRRDAGLPSYSELTRRVAAFRKHRGDRSSEASPGRTTVYDAFTAGRRRLDPVLVSDLVRVLGGDEKTAVEWGRRCAQAQQPAIGQAVVVHQQLASDGVFVGRVAEVERIQQAVAGGGVALLSGLGGLGKTALALSVARRLVAENDAAFLSIELRGDVPEQAVHADAAIDALLAALGSPVQVASMELRRDRLAALLDATPHVLLLDNAADVDQIEALIPSNTRTAVLVTSRARLIGVDADINVPLTGLDSDDAVALLSDLAGSAMDGVAPTHAETLAEAAGGFPLALEFVAGRVREMDDWTVEDHISYFADRRRQHQLDGSLTVVMAAAYAQLSEGAQYALRMLANHSAPDIDAEAFAALGDLADSGRVLGELRSHSVVSEPLPGRIGLHDMVRAYAVAVSAESDRPSVRHLALKRLEGNLLSSMWGAHEAIDTLRGTTRKPPADLALRPFDADGAGTWLTANVDTLLAVAEASAVSDPDVVVQVADALSEWLDFNSRYRDALWLNELALSAARQKDEPLAVARMSLALGHVYQRLGQLAYAQSACRTAYEVYAREGEDVSAHMALNAMAIVQMRAGHFVEAVEAYIRVAEWACAHESPWLEIAGRSNAASCLHWLGRDAEALGQLTAAMAPAETLDNRWLVSAVRLNMAESHLGLGEIDVALAEITEVVQAVAEPGIEHLTGHAAAVHSTILRHVGDLVASESAATLSLETARSNGDQELEARALIELGRCQLKSASLAEARSTAAQAIAVSTAAADLVTQALAHELMGDVSEALDDQTAAQDARTTAIAVFGRLGSRLVERVAAS